MGRETRAIAFIASVCALAAMPAAASATPVSYTFPAGDNQGWDACQDFLTGCVAGDATTGALSGADSADDAASFFNFNSGGGLPSLAGNYGGTWSFDFTSSATPSAGREIEVTIRNAMNHALLKEVAEPTSSSGSASVLLTEPGWLYCPAGCFTATEAQFRALLAEADYLEVIIDLVDGTGETYTIDNLSLTDAPVPATQPPASGPTGQRARAIKRCKKKFPKGTGKRKRCLRKARSLPV